jgi:uncharacterized protein YndB with AHSA1/START domain
MRDDRLPGEEERLHESELVVEQRIEAPPGVVFSYFTDPEKYRRWKGERAELDPRPGGRYRVEMGGGPVMLGEYVEVEAPRRLVFTWGWEGDDSMPPGSTTVEVTLIPDRDATLVRLRHRGFPTMEAREQHLQGWQMFLARLAATALGADPGSNRLSSADS